MQRNIKSSLVLLSLLLLTACTGQPVVEVEPKPVPEQPPAPVVETPVVEEPKLPYISPLTGLGSNQPPEQRPIMVMINNAPPARPQTGLNQADMIYEVLAEGEMTRFLTLYQSQKPEVIGPVRSIRPYFIQLGVGFDAVLIHAGGSQEALNTLARSDYSHLDEIPNGRYFWREQFRKMPHNLYTKIELIEQAMLDKGMRTTAEPVHFTFLPEDAVITEGEPATSIGIIFHSLNKAGFQYDAEKKKYMRLTEGKPHIDLSDNEQLTATNVLVISSKHRVLDSEGRRQVDVVGPGDGYLFQQGKAKKIKWKRSNGVIKAYADEAMTQEMPLLPGQTWVEIVPNSPGLAQSLKFQ
ncbi:DUF3048 domain-containing protein [Brevibacillus invocatus]|uniref:DUF3048 domain-containing protein n=1 Tax=Brevibacillus invocatus TaxID=173959 RepID=UPI002041934B|nr:DUF3048 domain-containing protein [Brevibacillus invocatus]MCM3079768.1 DUF3048 domain-containing protein [Brevibacillus invocatus]MCM3429962.1 DUF3048 domain-containing protein [Brevibacillus invocatus]